MTHAQAWREACACLVDEDRSTMMGLALSIARKHCTTLKEMRGERRTRNIADARQEFYTRASFELGKSNREIGRFINRDQSTVWGGIKRFRDKVGAWRVAA